MPPNPARDVAAHLIVGAREEPFLPALLESIADVADVLIANDNSGLPESPNLAALHESRFGREGRMLLDRAPFVDFASARNRCLELHRRGSAGAWVAFVDADEVHGPAAPRIASALHTVAPSIDFVDGYTWHFFQSFDWYTSIERRMAFFRFSPALRWEGSVHERLVGARGGRLALPYVYAHYGHVLAVRRHAEKGRLYARLGYAGPVVPEEELDRIDVAAYFRMFWPLALRFYGRHPIAARETIARLRARFGDEYRHTDRLVRAAQKPVRRLVNVARRLNFEQRWRARIFSPAALRLVRGAPSRR
jgi:hypothetical protein